MMVDRPTIYYNGNYDCRLLTINAILSRVIDSPNLLWSQAGLAIYESENDFYFTPYYIDTFEYLNKTANIISTEIKNSDMTELYRNLKYYLEKGYTAMISVDIYELPFNMYYKKHRTNHYIEITGIQDECFVVCDHFYKYSGFVDVSIIEDAMLARMNEENKKAFTFIYFNIENHSFNINNSYLKRVMTQNNAVILGDESAEIFEIPDYTRYFGLQTFDIFNSFLKDNFHQKGPLRLIYRSLFNLSNSRHHYSNLLSAFSTDYPELEDIVSYYKESSQNFRIASNLVLKLRASKKEYAYLSNLNNIILANAIIEKKAATLVESLLEHKLKKVIL